MNISRNVKVILGLTIGTFMILIGLFIYRPSLIGSQVGERVIDLNFDDPHYYGIEYRNGLSLSLRRSATLENEAFTVESDRMMVKGYLADVLYEGIGVEQTFADQGYNPREWIVVVFYVDGVIVAKDIIYRDAEDITSYRIDESTLIISYINKSDNSEGTHELNLYDVASAPDGCISIYNTELVNRDVEYVTCYR